MTGQGEGKAGHGKKVGRGMDQPDRSLLRYLLSYVHIIQELRSVGRPAASTAYLVSFALIHSKTRTEARLMSAIRHRHLFSLSGSEAEPHQGEGWGERKRDDRP